MGQSFIQVPSMHHLLKVPASAQEIANVTAAMKPMQPKSNDVLYLIRSWHKNYGTRVRSILDTWAADLDKSSLLFVGDTEAEDPTRVEAATGCATDHWAGLCCKTAVSLSLALQHMGSRKWLMVLDDDVYANPAKIEHALLKHNASSKLAMGIVGCGAGTLCKDKTGGFCGGGGYAISRPALEALVGGGAGPQAAAFQRRYMDFTSSPFGQNIDDVSTTCLLKQEGVKIEGLRGLYGWRLKEGGDFDLDEQELYRNKIKEGALTFHYIQDRHTMTSLHEYMLESTEHLQHADVSLLQSAEGLASMHTRYDAEAARFVEHMNAAKYLQQAAWS